MDCKVDGERQQTKVRANSAHRGSRNVPGISTPIRICILGGFGDLYQALYLRRFPLLLSSLVLKMLPGRRRLAATAPSRRDVL